MKCPECGNEPLEVYGFVVKKIIGEFDNEGNLTTETNEEKVTEIICSHCKLSLPLTLIKNWS